VRGFGSLEQVGEPKNRSLRRMEGSESETGTGGNRRDTIRGSGETVCELSRPSQARRTVKAASGGSGCIKRIAWFVGIRAAK